MGNHLRPFFALIFPLLLEFLLHFLHALAGYTGLECMIGHVYGCTEKSYNGIAQVLVKCSPFIGQYLRHGRHVFIYEVYKLGRIQFF